MRTPVSSLVTPIQMNERKFAPVRVDQAGRPLPPKTLSDHNLKIESGRHKKIERQQRFCSSCNSYNIGDELHFLFECSELYLIRAVFSKRC